MKCSEPFLDLVRWALCSSWCRTTPDLMSPERAGGSWMMKAVIRLAISFFCCNFKFSPQMINGWFPVTVVESFRSHSMTHINILCVV